MEFLYYLRLLTFDDEMDLISMVVDTPFHRYAEHSMWNMLASGETEEQTYDEMTVASKKLREEGNKLFNAKRAKRDVLGACRLCTRAIFAAPEYSAELALAHASRSMALEEFGYFRQAYDDCVCALELGFVDHLRTKIVMRQATCALHLGEVAQVQRHLDELDAMPLKGRFPKIVQELREKLAEFLSQQRSETAEAVEGELAVGKEEKLALLKRQKIVHTAGPAGRHMVATQAIGQHELIFSDSVAAFIPLNGEMMCQQCGLKELIPFPCKRCRCRVFYCSSKCKAAHAQIHAFECTGYRLKFFEKITTVQHLGFRMLLEGLPHAIPLLRQKENAQALWEALVGKDGDSIAANDSIAYAQVLRLMQHVQSMQKEELANHVTIIYVMLMYMKKYTDFFKLTEGTAATRRDWKMIIAALLLRHIGQVKVNSDIYSSIVRMECSEFILMSDGLWIEPLRIPCGRLHLFNRHRTVGMAIFPYLSMCNHNCKRTFATRFSGRNVHAFALNDLRAGADVTHCYSSEYCNSKRQSRRANLMEGFHFECRCATCESDNPDEVFKKCHRYRCDNLKCREIFVPHLPQDDTLKWWEKGFIDGKRAPVKCTVCGVEQSFKWFGRIENLFGQARNDTSRRMLYRRFDELDNWLLGQHELKLLAAIRLLDACFVVLKGGGARLIDAEYTILARIAKFVVIAIETRCSISSGQYACGMAFFWDLIALGKYKCTRAEIQPMLRAVDILSDEFQTVFTNYYRDYIEPLLLP